MKRIAMWSGPRNISTAMMRSWESRSDTFVIDEPFYPYYLSKTDVDHPGREEIIASGELDEMVVGQKLISEANIMNYDYITDSFSLTFSKSISIY